MRRNDSHCGLNTPISKRLRFIIVRAGCENGVVSNHLLIFKSWAKNGNYNDDMNYSNYETWLRSRLLLNIRANSVVVLHNGAYNNVRIDPAPTSLSRKADMTMWLTQHGIPSTHVVHNLELYSPIKIHQSVV